jgi:hypothetical protein
MNARQKSNPGFAGVPQSLKIFASKKMIVAGLTKPGV